MRTLPLGILWVCLISTAAPVPAQTESEIDVLRAELAQMRADYEARIVQLEQRLDAAEQKAENNKPHKQTPGSLNRLKVKWWPAETIPSILHSASSFRVRHGVIAMIPMTTRYPGFPLGGETGPLPEGFSLGEIEINISANVDDKFTAWLTAPIAVEDGESVIEVEEAWVETMAMPAGFSLRMGRFFSNIGYLNDKHAHSWDFADLPLAYQVFLGGQFIDDGLQLRWLAPTDLYFELGAQVTRGDRYPAGGAGRSGLGSYALLHAITGGDVGFSHSWRAGISYLQARPMNVNPAAKTSSLLFSGDSDLADGGIYLEVVTQWQLQAT